MKVAVTGGAGFIGSHLVDALAAAGHEVLVIDDLSSGNVRNLKSAIASGNVILRPLDVAAREGLEEAFLDFRPERIVHLAALVSVQRSVADPLLSFHSNAMGTFNVFHAALRLPSRPGVVYASSSAVYGAQTQLPHSEPMAVSPLSPYAADKSYAENLAHALGFSCGLSSVGLRFFNVYGERQDASSPYSGVVSIFADKLESGGIPTIFGDGTQSRDFVHVFDVVAAIVSAMEKCASLNGRASVFNVGTGVGVSILDLLSTMCDLRGVACSPRFEEARAAEVRHSVADMARAHSELDWMPVIRLRQGLARMVRPSFHSDV